jgi:hypothetical protein
MSNDRRTRDTMYDKENELNIEHADWLLKARVKNQNCYRICTNSGRKTEALESAPVRRSLFALLAGGVSSLWRAAFLSDTERTWEKTFHGVNYLLVTLIEDNVVFYSVDRKSQDRWGTTILTTLRSTSLGARKLPTSCSEH